MNYQTVIQFLSEKKAEVSSYAAELSSMGFKDEAAALWAEEDELVKRIGVLLDNDQEQSSVSTSDMSMFENIDGIEND